MAQHRCLPGLRYSGRPYCIKSEVEHLPQITGQYFGLHPAVFKNTATQAVGYAKQASDLFTASTSFWNSRSPPPVPPKVPVPALPAPAQNAASGSIWKKWAPAAYAVGGALIAGAAAGTAYYKRDELGAGYSWATDHMKYVGTLWEEATLKKRVDDLLQIEEKLGVMFRT